MCGVDLRSHQSHVSQWGISQTGWTARGKVGRFTHLNAIQTHHTLTGNEDIKDRQVPTSDKRHKFTRKMPLVRSLRKKRPATDHNKQFP